MRIGRLFATVALGAGAVIGTSCGTDHPGTTPPVDGGIGGQVGGGTGGATGIAMACIPAPRASEDLTPRVDVMRPSASQRAVKTSDLYTRFNAICGSCHVSAANGGFSVSANTFPIVFDSSRLARIESDDPNFAMPPYRIAFSSRAAGDPVRELARLLELWLAQGRPVDQFVDDNAGAATGASTAAYSYSVMTNLGDCIPSKQIYASSPSGEMDAKDALFATATTLPKDLADTDLTTLDTAVLAANGLVAFRPTYPLWSDGSGKLRFIRVPKGTSVKFDKAKQTFEIPPNTRFYKTFLREVTDSAGRISHKKMETRLIVTRPDTVDADGNPVPTALFGTYVWSDDEMSASLLDVPYRDETGFADRTAEYITNEVAYRDVIDNLGPGAASLADKLKNELKDPKHAGLIQHYAIPGSLRCVQCHRGSSTHDFALGFNPLQIAQRQANTGGTYDPVDADEMNQLQRFINYGLITGMTSPADVVLLEDSQAPRHARTPEELKAQGYMIGNCAHCHNPRGYPSLAKPELATTLNFLPGSPPENAGIFELSLELMSPVRRRGANQDIPIPYITPSLRDYPVANTDMIRVDNGAVLKPEGGTSGTGDNSLKAEVTWSPKYAVDREGGGGQGCVGVDANDKTTRTFCGNRTTGRTFVAAPWRSILYRNVDTPFPYFDDYVPFPHMPMNTAGFDCRAPRIMGDWMVGLPALLKPAYRSIVSEDALPFGLQSTYYVDAPQPYVEVKPNEDDYPEAVLAAQARLHEYHGGVRYQYCQDVLSTDIKDPVFQLLKTAPDYEHNFYPLSSRYIFGGEPPEDPTHPGQYAQPAIGVPYHGEWFDYDPTEKSPWQPRRDDWEPILVRGESDIARVKGTEALSDEEIVARRRLSAAIGGATISDDLRTYATTELPYGLWQPKPECASKFVSAIANGTLKKVSDFAANPPAWMSHLNPPPSPAAPVYMMSPGAALYRHICFNCHGPKADGKGLQADALAASSEGQARPANLSGGFFGPPEALGSNSLNAFGLDTGDPTTANLWASRYMAWMTLGGTLQLIPHNIINQVEATRILGETRVNLAQLGLTETVSANMLNLAKRLCAVVLPDQSDATLILKENSWTSNDRVTTNAYPPFNREKTPFIRTNGDWEMWMNICGAHNAGLVRVYGERKTTDSAELYLKAIYFAEDAGGAVLYPPDGQVWDQNAQKRSLRPENLHPKSGAPADLSVVNLFPACLQDPNDPGSLLPGEGALNLPDPQKTSELLAKIPMPLCPKAFLQRADWMMWSSVQNTDAQVDNMREWSLHGAINAGMSVFSYLQKADLAHNNLPLYYNECQRLP